ncbi:MAG: tetratricopeptide repeat protein [Bacteroidales bacterium]|nr:tetratricopeptide repeat protein [Bacteroidales bacterium]MCL2133148.1 tetratricopeptide repeat protein [Bacteroidales bacterium]
MFTEEDYLQQGKAFQQKQQWAEAINAYKEALELNPESKAKFALDYIYEILDFRYTDLLNP